MIKIHKTILLLFLVLISVAYIYAQKEANVWYFGEKAGLDFNTGQPQILLGQVDTRFNCASISNTAGNFLFATDGEIIYNSEHQIMQNGNELNGARFASAGVLILQKPGFDHLYYIFTVPDYLDPPGLYYSVVDMMLDNGLGAVTQEKNIPLDAAWDALEKLTSVKHTNGHDIWIIARKHEEDAYVNFLLTSSGISDEVVISYSPNRPVGILRGNMKVSYNKKYFISAYAGNGIPADDPDVRFDVNRFDASTGEIEFIYSISFQDGSNSPEPNSVEFSPDSKLAYLCVWGYSTENDDGTEHRVYQYDMSLIEDSAQFAESSVLISHNGGSGIQLSTDGKIYCGINDYSTEMTESPVHVIHDPWKRGTACNFEENAIEFPEDHGALFYFPNILLDHLYRFEFEGHCSADPFYFQSNFQPDPAFIEWNFGDPFSGNNISHDINPTHTFSQGGEFEVHVHVEYPNGRIEETSRVVTVTATPYPYLGPDILKCEGEEITLNAGNDEGMYSWSTGVFGENLNEITVSDTGRYWVQVNNDGCLGYDTIYVGLFPKPEVNEDSLQIIPTACGGSTGKILGLQVTGKEPLTFEWYDADSNYLSNTLDLSDLAVGNYFLHISDGYGCITISDPYTIEDAGDVEITEVEKEDSHCNHNQGSITITAGSGSTGDLLYSIDNGDSWQIGNSSFENLLPGNYFIRVKDESGCESVYANNPVVIENIAGPEVTQVNTVPENDYLSNGQIDITATTVESQLHFSIDNGTIFQTDNGLFSNLSAGTYNCVVKDDYGCDTSFTIEVNRIISQLIEAIAGNGNTCIGNAAVVPLKLNNFTNIYKFHVKLTYDTAILNCDGYINIHPELENNLQASIVPGTDEVIVSWQGEASTSLEENATMLELVFGAKDEGVSGIDWAATEGESAFYNEDLNLINADYHVGILRVYTRPRILLEDKTEVCEGDDFFTFPFILGGSGEVTYEWTGPDNFYSTNEAIVIQNLTQQHEGIYTLTVTDTIDCIESTELHLTVNETPQIAFADYDTLFAESGFILEAGSGFESYLWNTGDTTDAIQVSNEGLYSVFVTSTESCKSTDSVTVLWGGEPFYLPNAFTPNGDGLNDEFKPVQRYDFVKTYHLSIYNRWGEMIFETGDIEKGWDGTYKGQLVQQGTYVYRIVYTAHSTGNETQVKTKHLTLVR